MDLNCPGCSCEYDTVEREPQNLSCGCDLCLFCVDERRGGKCAEGHDVDWNRVTISRRVLKMVQAAQFSCPTHKGRQYDFWCPTCRVPLCGICAVSHKDICLRGSGGSGVGSGNPSFYLIEMNQPSAAEDLIRLAQEHSKSIEQSTADLEESIPSVLLKQPDEFAEYIQNKALEAVAAFYQNLDKVMSELWDRYNKERQSAMKEEEKRDYAVVHLAEIKGNIDMGVMELNVAVQQFREVEKHDRKEKEKQQFENKDNSNNNVEEQMAGSQQGHKSQKQLAAADMCSKAGQLASMVQKLVNEQNNGSLKGSVSCSHIRGLADLKVIPLECMHPQWTTPDPPPKSCPLYKGIVRVRPSVFGVGATSSDPYLNSSSSSYAGAQQAADYSSASASRTTAGSRLTGPRVGATTTATSYESRDLSPSSRRPRLMESLWREQIRGESTSYNNNNNNSPGSRQQPTTTIMTSSTSGPMISPSGTSGFSSTGRTSRY